MPIPTLSRYARDQLNEVTTQLKRRQHHIAQTVEASQGKARSTVDAGAYARQSECIDTLVRALDTVAGHTGEPSDPAEFAKHLNKAINYENTLGLFVELPALVSGSALRNELEEMLTAIEGPNVRRLSDPAGARRPGF